ncbi:hypothetical protein ACE15N_07120 [Xanthomonas campestris pv. passiflorae]|uniref:hypothetical protein n=1 Tax=Xanthomonas TaxID=338 RepID=UPI000A749152|nr:MULTISPECIES: hypothetical protein [Xanthomonas]MBO9735184.1 hypothetical protein [Xanthomonas phaseoli pv. phaseoli]MBO9743495.1 hypothetical protein [Xanthomonas phaseoli pv. phaseoli]MBV6813628.1 hypothetical protein [Xanthomonas campestris pv. passiflorae]MDM4798950.1 hypothetical protein [Xanthomonas phaseoli pv. phaseoli]MDM4803112.1 hypothetical protein [Xanthomonas phaseoli pv. phaseoli]
MQTPLLPLKQLRRYNRTVSVGGMVTRLANLNNANRNNLRANNRARPMRVCD